MMNVLNDVQQLEKDLMRDLLDTEISAVITKGWKKFVTEDLGMEVDEFQALLKMREILSAFCTKNQDAYEKALEGDISTPYLVFKRILEDMEDKLDLPTTNKTGVCPCGVTDKGPDCEVKSEEKECSRKDFKPCSIKGCSGEQAKGDFDLDKAVDSPDYGWIAYITCAIFDMLPAKDNKWLKEFIKLDPDYTELVNTIKEYADGKDKDEIDFDELCGDVSDYIKDTVVREISEKLIANKGKAIVLDEEILDEVFDYLLSTEKNIKVRAVNNLITVL